MEYTAGKVIPINIEDEMKKSYIDYAMSVIIGRALPDVRDGLKPVHRRILYAMHELALTPDKPHKKSARLVGEVLGKYHPHGDASVYDAAVRMAQDFSIRYPLIDGQGNFGSIDGDSAAAMRYTELRMSKISLELLRDIEKETVDFIPNFDGTLKEPAVLPAKIPHLLVNGSTGIAVGMATNIPPHNLAEVINGVIKLIDNPEVTIKELMREIKGPDFPTSAIILGRNGIKNAYSTGRGQIKIRARTQIEKINNGKMQIVVTEIPFQVNKARLIEQIAELVKDKKIDGITDLRDESDREGLRVVIELRRDVNPQIVLNQLFKHTALEQSYGIIMLAIVDGEPRILNLKEMLYYYLQHQKEVITRRTRYELVKAEDRAHILEGLRIALDNIDEIVNIIRSSENTETAKDNLMVNFALSEKQAQAILEMRLQRLTGLEREKIEDEYEELLQTIAYLRAVLADEKMVLNIIKEELTTIKEKYADKRRTEIVDEIKEFEIEDLIAAEDVVITLTNHGYIKRLPITTYKSQHRGGRGVAGIVVREEDFVENIFISNTHHYILFFTDKGKVHRLKVHEIPEASRQAKGTAIVNLIQIDADEKITAVIPVAKFDPDQYLLMATKQGIIKKTKLSEFVKLRKGGIIAVNLDKNDNLIKVKLTSGEQEVIIVTKYGKALRFREEDVREVGRVARGVKAITLEQNDEVIGMELIENNADLLVVTNKGFGKRTALTEFRTQSRGGKGVRCIRLRSKTDSVIGIRVVKEGNELMLITTEGIVIRLPVDDISIQGRDTQGVRLIKMSEGDSLVALANVVLREEKEELSK